ncbi:DNA-binding protein [Diaphorobacter caeni]|uniref:DNA-binding protein n=1 Tax=Diaphorobacter caeni TaxID=2784387 RepID=UPI00188FBCA4|nr:DNA-binding protein [Diaphorobacter caeni]MBF5006872.1 DNA-binding protein [Diaphorobacter caeni]
MRDYAKAVPRMWHGKTFKTLRKSPEGLIVAMYLMTSPSSNMLGLFAQPILYMAYETGLGEEGASKGLQSCIDAGFCSYDAESEFVWVHEMASYQIAPELKANDLRTKGVQRDYDALSENPFLGAFFDRYAAAFHLEYRRGEEGATQAPCKALRSQEQEQEQEQEKEQEQDKEPTASSAAKPPTAAVPKCEFDEIVAIYHDVLPNLPAVKLVSDSRKKAMKKWWDWILRSKKPSGARRATTADEALAWIREYFELATHNDFLMGRGARSAEHQNWKCDLDFLITERGLRHVIERTEVAA